MTVDRETTLWAERFFALVDRGDADGIATQVSEDASLVTGNGDPVTGRDAIRNAINHFQTMITSIHHDIVRTWRVGNSVIAELRVTYVRLDGQILVLPCANVFDLDEDGLVTDYKIFMDMSPVFS
jgi:ketosteroid isomerase-like protein